MIPNTQYCFKQTDTYTYTQLHTHTNRRCHFRVFSSSEYTSHRLPSMRAHIYICNVYSIYPFSLYVTRNSQLYCVCNVRVRVLASFSHTRNVPIKTKGTVSKKDIQKKKQLEKVHTRRVIVWWMRCTPKTRRNCDKKEKRPSLQCKNEARNTI